MKYLFLSLLLSLIIISFAFSQNKNQKAPIIIDHSSVKEFPSIPQNFIESATQYKLIFLHASVGNTINNGLNCVQGTRTHPTECKEFPPYKYNRANWNFQGLEKGGWYGKCDNFTSVISQQLDNNDIFSFKYCYLEGLDQVQEPCGNPFNNEKTMKAWHYLRDAYETLESKHPDKIFIIWTIPLTQVGQYCTDTLNRLIRKYAKDNNKILFDIADIETYDPDGNPTRNDKGWELAFKGYCGEQQPGAQACHPNWTCSIMLAKAFWVMIAKIAGWEQETGISSYDYNNKIDIFPQPTQDFANISIAIGLEQFVNISVFDMFGREINKIIENSYLQAGEHTYTMHLSSLPRGVYIVRLTLGGEIIYKTFVKI